MKMLIFSCLTSIFFSCQPMTKPVRNFIPGTYIRFSRHEYGTEYDTLVISSQNKSADQYRIVRKWKYERHVDGFQLEPEYKIVTTSGIYDAEHKLLLENETRDNYSFDVKTNCLFKGHTKYQKL